MGKDVCDKQPAIQMIALLAEIKFVMETAIVATATPQDTHTSFSVLDMLTWQPMHELRIFSALNAPFTCAV